MFAPEHGRAVAAAIPGAVLVEIDGVGHEVPDDLDEDFLGAVTNHVAMTEQRA